MDKLIDVRLVMRKATLSQQWDQEEGDNYIMDTADLTPQDQIAITHMAERVLGDQPRCLQYPKTWGDKPCDGCTAPLD